MYNGQIPPVGSSWLKPEEFGTGPSHTAGGISTMDRISGHERYKRYMQERIGRGESPPPMPGHNAAPLGQRQGGMWSPPQFPQPQRPGGWQGSQLPSPPQPSGMTEMQRMHEEQRQKYDQQQRMHQQEMQQRLGEMRGRLSPQPPMGPPSPQPSAAGYMAQVASGMPQQGSPDMAGYIAKAAAGMPQQSPPPRPPQLQEGLEGGQPRQHPAYRDPFAQNSFYETLQKINDTNQSRNRCLGLGANNGMPSPVTRGDGGARATPPTGDGYRDMWGRFLPPHRRPQPPRMGVAPTPLARRY